MKTMKKIIALLMAASMLITLAACSKKETSVAFDENGNYVVPDKLLELTVWETQGTDYAATPILDNNIVAKWLEEKTNVRVENMYGNDGGSWDAKLTKLVAGDNLPDIIKTGAFQGPAHFNKVKELKQLVELTPEMIQKAAPNLWNRTPKEIWDAFTTEDGKLLGIPWRIDENYDEPFYGYSEEEKNYIRETQLKYETDVTFQSTGFLYIRDDILKEFYPDAKTYDELVAIMKETNKPLGDVMLDIPLYTTEEFIDFLYKIQEKGYKEGGKTVYPLGYNGGDNWMALTWIGADMLGYKNHAYSGTLNYKTKEYEMFLLKDTVKEAARIQNQLLNDEIIESESLAQSSTMYKEKVLNGQYAIAATNVIQQPGEVNKMLKDAGKTFRYRPFITQIPNKEEYPAFREKVMWHNAMCFTKQMTEGEIMQVLNWINVQYSDEYEDIFWWGPKEANLYETLPDGTRRYKDDRFNKYFLEGDTSVLEKSELMGLGNTAGGSMMNVYALYNNKYVPQIFNKSYEYQERSDGGFRFPPESEHVKNVKTFPATQIWSSIYAEIPEVVDFWSAREQWEAKIRIALGAAPGTFEERWSELESTIRSIVDVEAFEKACTEAVTPYLNQMN